jgi:hypothetical protein
MHLMALISSFWNTSFLLFLHPRTEFILELQKCIWHGDCLVNLWNLRQFHHRNNAILVWAKVTDNNSWIILRKLFFFCVITQDCCTFFVRSRVRCVGCRKAHGCLHWFSCWQSCPSARKIASYNVLCCRQTQGSTNLDDDLLWREWTSNEQTRSWGSYCLLLAAHKTT